MRRKKNLEQRISDCGEYFIKFYDETNRDHRINNIKEYIDFEKMFGNKNDVVLEIGCGKGNFACTLAKQNPNINVLAVEKSENVLVHASETAIKESISNVRFICCGAEYLQRYIAENSISRIYLNFSCPFPKNRYASHRLTAKRFLGIYENILMSNAEIHQKTDNQKFFEYSIEQYSDYGYTIKNVSLDLHNSDFEGNIETEYEQKFSSIGMPIYRLEAFMKEV